MEVLTVNWKHCSWHICATGRCRVVIRDITQVVMATVYTQIPSAAANTTRCYTKTKSETIAELKKQEKIYAHMNLSWFFNEGFYIYLFMDIVRLAAFAVFKITNFTPNHCDSMENIWGNNYNGVGKGEELL